jgi:hypothetical protein
LLATKRDLVQWLARLRDAGLLPLDDLGKPIREAKDSELRAAISQAKALATTLGAAAAVIQVRHGRDYAAASLLSELDRASPFLRAWIVLFCLRLPQVLTPEELKYARDNFDAFKQEQLRLGCIKPAA